MLVRVVALLLIANCPWHGFLNRIDACASRSAFSNGRLCLQSPAGRWSWTPLRTPVSIRAAGRKPGQVERMSMSAASSSACGLFVCQVWQATLQARVDDGTHRPMHNRGERGMDCKPKAEPTESHWPVAGGAAGVHFMHPHVPIRHTRAPSAKAKRSGRIFSARACADCAKN